MSQKFEIINQNCLYPGIGVSPPPDEDADDPLADTEQTDEKPEEIEEVSLVDSDHSDSDDEIVVDPSSLLSFDVDDEQVEPSGAQFDCATENPTEFSTDF